MRQADETSYPLSRRDFVFSTASAGTVVLCLLLTGMAFRRQALAAPTQARGEEETAALTAAQQQYDEAKDKLETIGAQLEDTKYQRDQTADELKQLGVDIEVTQSGIDDKTRELDQAQNALAALMQITYKSGHTSMLDIFFSSSSINDLVTRTYYAAKVQNAQVSTIEDIRVLKKELEERRATLSSQQDEQNKLLVQLDEQEQQLKASQDEANQVLAQLSVEVQELFAAQQTELQAAAQARASAQAAAEGGEALGVYAPSKSQGSIVENAYACLGIPYVWGGDDENFAEKGGFDCSGFCQHCYALEGWAIGRTTWDQIDQINAAGNWRDSLDDLQQGDLIFPRDSHVGIYIGNYQMIDAPYPGMFIQVDDITDFLGGGSPI